MDVKGLYRVLAERKQVNALDAQYRAKMKAIDAATSAEEVEAITWQS